MTQETPPRGPGRPLGAKGPNRTAASPLNQQKPWYDDIVWWFASNPGGSGKACAAALGKSEVYINQLLRSDFLQARLKEMRRRRVDELNATVVGAAASAVTALRTRIEDGPISTQQLTEATDTLLAACGLGRAAPVPPQMPQNVAITVNSTLLTQARERMSAPAIEHVAHRAELPAPQLRAETPAALHSPPNSDDGS